MTFDLDRMLGLMGRHDVERVYVKRLAANDNSKNQIYLGSDFEALNILPNQGVRRDGRIFKAPVRFSWLSDSGALNPCPGAQLILYPQYPEVRLSSLLRGCPAAPSGLIRDRIAGRVLFLGVRSDGQLVAYLASAADQVARQFDKLHGLSSVGVFNELLVIPKAVTSRSLLLRELRRIHLLEWIAGKRLRAVGVAVPCAGQNCGGYTLEAELGILPNALGEPDFHGWEIKQIGVRSFSRFGSQTLTLITPEPTGGFYRKQGPRAFVRRFGYPDRLGRPDRVNFGGIHRVADRHPGTGLRLALDGFNSDEKRITNPLGCIRLMTDDGEVAASWPFLEFMRHWNIKHALAAYVPAQSRRAPGREYRYGRYVYLGQETDFVRLLHALALGNVYYDPGIKLEAASTQHSRIKLRSQFRVRARNLGSLYRRFEKADVLSA